MQEYYFLFGLGFLWLAFAVVQDVRTREISNWLNFSLLAFALTYRGFYALESGRASFFWWGIAGTLFFAALSHVLYYGRAFAGGDAKLLMAIGPLVPFNSMPEMVFMGIGFVFALFLFGSIYGLIYTACLIPSKWNSFKRVFLVRVRRTRKLFFLCFALGGFAFLLFSFIDVLSAVFFFFAFALLPFLYAYGKSAESCLFIKRLPASKLTEGDWLVYSVRAGKQVIEPNFHGLALNEIKLLQRARKTVLIKEGVPFSPAFLLAFLATVFYVLW